MQKPLILISNDDGITAPGMRNLVLAVKEMGEIVVVAPDSARSGHSNAITLEKPIILEEVKDYMEGVEAYKCSGTPVDCIKLAKSIILKDRKIDLCLSGVNHGANNTINVVYSGTMAAAMEASISGIPAIGFSILNFGWDANFDATRTYITKIVSHVLKNGMGDAHLLNVNVPDLPAEELKGIKLCRQAKNIWVNEFEERINPHNKKYYWMTGELSQVDKGTDNCQYYLNNGYVSIVPCIFDLTDYQAIPSLAQLESL